MQAGILASAGIIVRIIGLLYNTPLVAIIGDEGNGYYNSAYYAYSIILLISSYSIPSAVSKVIAQRLATKEYRNAHRIFCCAFIYVLVVGSIASLFVFFGAGLLVEMESAIFPLKILAPTIFFSGILGVLRGYFQAHKTMVQTSVSQSLLMPGPASVWHIFWCRRWQIRMPQPGLPTVPQAEPWEREREYWRAFCLWQESMPLTVRRLNEE